MYVISCVLCVLTSGCGIIVQFKYKYAVQQSAIDVKCPTIRATVVLVFSVFVLVSWRVGDVCCHITSRHSTTVHCIYNQPSELVIDVEAVFFSNIPRQIHSSNQPYVRTSIRCDDFSEDNHLPSSVPNSFRFHFHFHSPLPFPFFSILSSSFFFIPSLPHTSLLQLYPSFFLYLLSD